MKNLLVFVFVVVLATFSGAESEELYNPENDFSAKMPESCEGMDYCFDFDPELYPTDIVKQLVSELPELNLDEDDTGYVEDRQGDANQICLSTTKTNPIYFIVDERNDTRVVIQEKGVLQQLVTVTRCNNEGPLVDSNVFLQKTVDDYNIRCMNKYTNYELLVLSETRTINQEWKMEKAKVKIPVCCSCRYDKKVVNENNL